MMGGLFCCSMDRLSHFFHRTNRRLLGLVGGLSLSGNLCSILVSVSQRLAELGRHLAAGLFLRWLSSQSFDLIIRVSFPWFWHGHLLDLRLTVRRDFRGHVSPLPVWWT